MVSGRKLAQEGRDWAVWGEGPELAGSKKVWKRVALMELDHGVRTMQSSAKLLELWRQSHRGVKKLTKQGMQV